ncbi:hypothetical protein QVD17_05786 [Tagetes erecta]|uniref:Uncharacterized protein n=1 Tax=Tagetes erecta TaxID=13708 RepID=A0AAD8LJC1_TARER|nr:hypothetical protein QVD17_05786 [Tagetes erecta]
MLWMTSASELFHSRRYRSGLRNNTVAITGFDSSVPDFISSSSFQHRSAIRRHSQHYSSQNNRREHRHDFDACVPASRRIHRHRLRDQLEHQPVSAEEGGSHRRSDSVISSDGFSSVSRHNRPTGTGNDRLPGSVLLARERLVERLRGVTASGNRQSRGSSSITHQNVLEIRNNTTAETVSESLQETRRRNRPSGLNEDELKCLQWEVFSSVSCRQNDESSSGSMECSICLEGFEDGDKIVRNSFTTTPNLQPSHS